MEQRQFLWGIVIIALIVVGVIAFSSSNQLLLLGPKSSAGNGTGNQTLLPDLVVSALFANATNQGNLSRVVVTAVIRNIGNANAERSTTRIFVSPVGGERLLNTSAIHANGRREVSTTYSLTRGNYTAVGSADWFDFVRESNENNNERTTFFFV